MQDSQDDEISLLSKEEAIAEVRRWLEKDKVDPEKIFAASGETTIRYKDLIHHLSRRRLTENSCSSPSPAAES